MSAPFNPPATLLMKVSTNNLLVSLGLDAFNAGTDRKKNFICELVDEQKCICFAQVRNATGCPEQEAMPSATRCPEQEAMPSATGCPEQEAMPSATSKLQHPIL